MSLSVYKDFKQFVRAMKGEHLKLGDYMEELDRAVLRYMAAGRSNLSSNTHTRAHSQILAPTAPPKTLKLRDEIIQYLESKYKYEDLSKTYEATEKHVLVKHLKEAIRYVRGTDPRTIKSGLNDLSEGKLIRETRGQTGVFDFAPFEQEQQIQKKEFELLV